MIRIKLAMKRDNICHDMCNMVMMRVRFVMKRGVCRDTGKIYYDTG